MAHFGALIWVHPSFWCKSDFLIFIMDEYQATVCRSKPSTTGTHLLRTWTDLSGCENEAEASLLSPVSFAFHSLAQPIRLATRGSAPVGDRRPMLTPQF